MRMKQQQNRVTLAVMAGLSLSATSLPGMAAVILGPSTTIYNFSMSGNLSMIYGNGYLIDNTSLPKGTNTYLTPLSGTLSLEVTEGAISGGGLSVQPFFFLSNQPGEDFTIHDSQIVGIGDGAGGNGSLLLGNMLVDWNGNTDIPLSIVWDGAGVLGAIGGGIDVGNTVSGVGAQPAVDGSYIYSSFGYVELGPTPLATTDWNTSLAPGCEFGVDNNFVDNTGGGCMGYSVSGVLPLIADTATNDNRYDLSTATVGDLLNGGLGIGGSPMPDGPFRDYNFNIDISDLTLQEIVIVDPISEVPLPAAVWLFGAGLGTLLAVSRRRSRR